MAGAVVEIELKYIGPDIRALRLRLDELGAYRASARALERNVVFDDERMSLMASQRLLRLRDHRELTLKEPLQDDRYKVRRELTLQIERGDVEAFLRALGYRPTWHYEKYRQVWDLDHMAVMIDELPFLGTVVEIEGKRDRIEDTARKLGLDGLPTSSANYRSLFIDYATTHGFPPADLTFEAERNLTP
jgi:predicted adenylyl cyclase CyaB